MIRILSLALVTASAAIANAQITVDGTLDPAYGAPLAVQTVNTGFGDEDGINDANGGELDAIYAAVENGRLFLMVTGNLETDSFNKLNIFIDNKPGGENTLSADPNYDFGDVSANLGLISFAPGFEADLHLYGRAGGGNFEVDVVDRLGGTSTDVLADTGSAALSGDFGVATGSTDPLASPNGSGVVGSVLTTPVDFALDNSNSAGVGEGAAAADQVAAAAVMTGAEFSISLADLGVGLGDSVSLIAGYSNGDYNFWSNQFLPGLAAPQANLGADGVGTFPPGGDASGVALDLSAITPLVITIIPEPTSALLVALAAIGVAARRR